MRNQGSRRGIRLAAAGAIAGLLGSMGAAFVGAPSAGAAYTTACGGADTVDTAFDDAGLAADCLALYGLSQGKTDGTFGETDPLVRTQVSSLFVRLLRLADVALGTSTPLSDTNQIPNEQVRTEVELLVGSGIIAGFPDGTFKGGNPLTVGQFATLLLRVAKLFDDSITVNMSDTAANVATARALGLLNDGAASQSGAAYPTDPTATAQRGLVADALAELLDDLVASGDVENRSPLTTNADFPVTPRDTATRVDDPAEPEEASDDGDQRTYTASGLDAGTYRVTLVNCSNVNVDSGGSFSFREDGTTGLALATPNDFAFIDEVNGDDATGGGATPVATVGGITPASGSITVVVDAEEYGCVRPVVFADDGDAGPAVDDDGEPTVDFGVGGELISLPAPHDDGEFTGTVLAVSKTTNLVVIQGEDEQFTVVYDSGDEFFLVANDPSATGPCPTFPAQPTGVFCTELTDAEFELAVSKDDIVSGTLDENGDSTFVLDDVALGAPTITGVEPGATTAVVTLADVAADATQVDIYVDEGDLTGEFDQAELVGTAASDASSSVAGFQVTIVGLNADTNYTAFATQTVDDVESGPSDGESFSTLIDQGVPTITAVAAGATTATFTVEVDADADSVTIHLQQGTLVGDFANADDKVVNVTEDADDDAAGFQVAVTGLTASTQYSAFATQTIDGQRSDPSVRRAFTTSPAPVTIALSSVAPGEENNGMGSTNAVVATFASAVDCGVENVVVTFGTSSTIQATGCTEGANANSVRFTLASSISDQPGLLPPPAPGADVTYTVTINEGSVVNTASPAAPVATTTGTFDY